MDWIGITGTMGAGKTTVSKLIADLGLPVEFADEVARRVAAPGTPGLMKITQTFGEEVVDSDGCLNRNRLGQTVFNDKSKLQALEAILHPLIQAEVAEFRRKAEQAGHEIGFYDVPLLFEKELVPNFDSIVCVVADHETVINRLKAREGWDLPEIERRLAHQLAPDVKVKGSQYIIENSGSLTDLKAKVEAVIGSLSTNPKRNPYRQ